MTAFPKNIDVSPGVAEFFTDFYRISDTPGAHEDYVKMFAPDATFKLGLRISVGQEQVLTTRKAMWASVASRKHTVHKIFPFGSSAREFMLYGIVYYTSTAGESSQKEWAGRAVLTETDGKWTFQFYQVYL